MIVWLCLKPTLNTSLLNTSFMIYIHRITVNLLPWGQPYYNVLNVPVHSVFRVMQSVWMEEPCGVVPVVMNGWRIVMI